MPAHLQARATLSRLLSATTIKGEETFAFDPVSNLLDPKAPRQPSHYPPPKLLDNLLRDYVGQHYTYDARGNLLEKIDNGKKATFTWDLHDRLIRHEDERLTAKFAYDALGRRLFKLSKSKYLPKREAGPVWNQNEERKLNEKYGCGYTIYGWDGDTLAFESRNGETHSEDRLTHFFYEPGSFVPVAQAVEHRCIAFLPEPTYDGGYDIDRDPLWLHKPRAQPFNAVAWYQCDHLGTPMELTDQSGEIAWSATYQAWGLAKEQRTDSAIRADIRNPLRFQGQYFDVETGLHYNRYRYYDPQVGRFIGKDPIGFAGGLNVYAYAPNPVGWVDPFGLAKCCNPSIAECQEVIANAGRDHGPYNEVSKDAHHVIQNAAALGLSGYGDGRTAYAVQLNGPSSKVGSEHYLATQSQRQKGVGGTYGSERVIGYRALRRAGINPLESRCHVMLADAHFGGLGVSQSTKTRIPGNRNSRGRKK